MPPIKQDDLVKVRKLRGPTMLVINVNEADITCAWFDKQDRLQSQVFVQRLLEVVKK